ncbi:hypothetical protein KAR91_24355 [Candidatus Pacearchaeota archaeon]|nr:hypothetical protein [Candidatus Pacearchaeota archaeon]
MSRLRKIFCSIGYVLLYAAVIGMLGWMASRTLRVLCFEWLKSKIWRRDEEVFKGYGLFSVRRHDKGNGGVGNFKICNKAIGNSGNSRNNVARVFDIFRMYKFIDK